MTDRLSDLRHHVPIGQQTFRGQEERSMRWLELALAITAIGVAALLAVVR
jgi:hypothetical protein